MLTVLSLAVNLDHSSSERRWLTAERLPQQEGRPAVDSAILMVGKEEGGAKITLSRLPKTKQATPRSNLHTAEQMHSRPGNDAL